MLTFDTGRYLALIFNVVCFCQEPEDVCGVIIATFEFYSYFIRVMGKNSSGKCIIVGCLCVAHIIGESLD